jgi:hypothetical protein
MTIVTPMNRGSGTTAESPSGDDFAEMVKAERLAQGLPPTIEDPAWLALVASAVREVLAAEREA